MPPSILSPYEAQFLPRLEALTCVNCVSEFVEGVPVVLLLFMTWSVSCKEAITQLLTLQNTQPEVFFACVSKEHSSTLRNEIQAVPELMQLNIYSDSRHILKPFLLANVITTVPTGILFGTNRRLMWHGHALSPSFVDNFTKLIRKSHIQVHDERALSFKLLRSSSCRSASATAKASTPSATHSILTGSSVGTRSMQSYFNEGSSTMYEESSSRTANFFTTSNVRKHNKILDGSRRQRSSSVQHAQQLFQSAVHDVSSAILKEGDLTLSAIMEKKLPPTAQSPVSRSNTITPTRNIVSPLKIHARSRNAPGVTGTSVSGLTSMGNTIRYIKHSPTLNISPKIRKTDPLQPLRSPTHFAGESSELTITTTAEESSYPLTDELYVKPVSLKQRSVCRSPAIAREIKDQMGWMLIKQDTILPKPVRLPISFPSNVIKDMDATEKLFSSSQMFLRRINIPAIKQ